MKFSIGLIGWCFFMTLSSSTALAKVEIRPKGSPAIEFAEPKHGETVKSPFKVKMVAKGIKVRPAGEAVDETSSGHHHILVNKDPIPKGQPIPTDDEHIHFGKAQTETELKLKPGRYKLTLQFADGAHRSYGPDLATTIEVNVRN